MAPKIQKKKAPPTEPKVNRDLMIFFSEVTNEDALEVLDIFRLQGWKHFLNYQHRFYVDEQIVEVYSTLKHDNKSDKFLATVTLKTQGESTSS